MAEFDSPGSQALGSFQVVALTQEKQLDQLPRITDPEERVKAIRYYETADRLRDGCSGAAAYILKTFPGLNAQVGHVLSLGTAFEKAIQDVHGLPDMEAIRKAAVNSTLIVNAIQRAIREDAPEKKADSPPKCERRGLKALNSFNEAEAGAGRTLIDKYSYDYIK